MIEESRLVLLIVRRLSGELTEVEAEELNIWAELAPANRAFLDRVTDEEQLGRELALWKNIDPAAGYEKWHSSVQVHRRAKIRRIIGWSAAASVLIAVAVIGLNRKSGPETSQSAPKVAVLSQPVLPGRNTATLTLANGQQILLDSAGNGDLAVQGRSRLIKTDDKSISYALTGKGKGTGVVYNMLTTPRSGQYQLTLPDGTHVWLNNVSTLRYPTAFQGADRTVELSGEAYFEIAKDATKPFFVKLKDETVEVLGTSFNIMAYAEEGSIQTTLLSGVVRVNAGRASVQLKPDEQARFNGAEGLKVLKGVPSQDIVSWKNGFFYFGRASLKEVMRQLARWYDVDVEYQGNVPDVEFGGKIDRSLPLNELLNFLDKNQVHFRLEGRKIIVLP